MYDSVGCDKSFLATMRIPIGFEAHLSDACSDILAKAIITVTTKAVKKAKPLSSMTRGET